MRLGLLLSLFLIGCANSSNKCGDKVLLLWPNENGDYKFQEVQLSTLKSPYELRGSAAEVYYESDLDDSGFHGRVAEPHLTRSGDTCVPTDSGSALSLSAYAQFERLYDYERRLGIADQLSWPRKVGVEIRVRGDPKDTHNNAHYYGAQDVIALVPYDRGEMPVTLNHGIVAHEHFHAHFQQQVINNVNLAMPLIISLEDVFYPRELRFQPTADDLQNTDPHSPRGLNNFVMRGWNEGLADFFAGVYTGRPDFFSASLSSAMANRHLMLPVEPLAIAADFQRTVAQMSIGKVECDLVCVAYGQGARLARLLFRLANSGMMPPDEFVTRVTKNLRNLPKRVIPNYSTSVLDSDAVLPVLLPDLPLNANACATLRVAAGKDVLQKGFPQCGRM